MKGTIGLGLPTLSLVLLTATLDLTTAMALLIILSFITNLWQAIGGGKTTRAATAPMAVSVDGRIDPRHRYCRGRRHYHGMESVGR